MKFFLIYLFSSLYLTCFAGEIALTFDDAPRKDGIYFSGENRTKILIEALKKANVPQVAFFCNTQQLTNNKMERLKSYSNAGHLIMNHTHGHLDIRKVSKELFLEDIIKAHDILKEFKTFQPIFRFPYLAEGDTSEIRMFLRLGLEKIGYKNGYVTVDNYDWYMDALFQKGLAEGKKVDLVALRRLYIETLWNGIKFYDEIGLSFLGRSPKHVLLLHENDLAALFIGDLIDYIRSKGWKIISPLEAYSDPISTNNPDTKYHNQGRVAQIAKANGYSESIWPIFEDEGYLEEQFIKNKIFLEKK